jgi:hypothetical protein
MAVSAPVNAAVEAVNNLFASFQPEDVMRDVDPFLEHLPDLFEALKKGLTSLGEKLGDQPVHPSVPDAVRDLIPVAAGLEDASRQPFDVFKARHAQEREQHLNPRPGERHWNVIA